MSETTAPNTPDMLRQFVALPRARQLTLLRYCLEAHAAGVAADGPVLRGMCGDLAAMDEAWQLRAQRQRNRRARA